jgi:hypothetical protein
MLILEDFWGDDSEGLSIFKDFECKIGSASFKIMKWGLFIRVMKR